MSLLYMSSTSYQPPNIPAAMDVPELGKYLPTLFFKKQLPSCPPSYEAVKFAE